MPPEDVMSRTLNYEGPAVHYAQCEDAIKQQDGAVEGVDEVEVDLATKLVTVRGTELDDALLRAAIDEAGYEVA